MLVANRLSGAQARAETLAQRGKGRVERCNLRHRPMLTTHGRELKRRD
jgi:hypothetical protein